MMDCPKYTFLLPAYKSKFLKQALDSMQRQTYKNFKVIISDDCSPEDVYSVCKHYLLDTRFSYRRNDSNIGSTDLVNHWNLLVDISDTEYLVMASDDDIYEPTFLEEIDKLTSKYKQAKIIRARTSIIDDKNNTTHIEGSFNEIVSLEGFLQEMHSPSFVFCVGNLIFKRNALIEGGRFEYFPMAAYSDNATMIKQSKDGCINTSVPLFNFRFHNSQLSSSVKSYNSRMKCLAGLKYDKWIKCWDIHDTEIYQLHKNRTKVLVWEDMYHCNFRDTIYCLVRVIFCGYFNIRKFGRFVWCKLTYKNSMY